MKDLQKLPMADETRALGQKEIDDVLRGCMGAKKNFVLMVVEGEDNVRVVSSMPDVVSSFSMLGAALTSVFNDYVRAAEARVREAEAELTATLARVAQLEADVDASNGKKAIDSGGD